MSQKYLKCKQALPVNSDDNPLSYHGGRGIIQINLTRLIILGSCQDVLGQPGEVRSYSMVPQSGHAIDR